MVGLGKFYGIGVGPGDPDLITIKAVKILERLGAIFAAGSAKNEYSIAESIVRPHISADTIVTKLPVPMTTDEDQTKAAYAKNAEKVWEQLKIGNDAAFLTLGDPMTYSTLVYLMRELKSAHPEVETEVIPGITSYSAAAAACQIPLAEHEESILIVSGARGGQRLKEQAPLAKNIVIMKTYKQFDNIKSSLENLGLADDAVLVSRAGLDGERVVTNLNDIKEPPNYLSLIIAKNGKHGRKFE